ncbi:hypothetical protein [Photobacterium leiognathi]|uniref:hypothetical protein n=1 Tax=Photobacterium leiognathi TaxID=553611 RepID=UPI000D176AB5|nr:hypothetical protein [Photobacterium leiognathi]PSW53047.1 hypothetical protein C0W50_19760 [Photobacterium leiognathi subsp. mandapamensis]
MDVMITNSQTHPLNRDEQAVLLGYASGLDAFDLCQHLGLSAAELNSLERDIRAKLAANTTPHMVSRAWQLGVLATRSLCMVLVLISSMQVLTTDNSRVRNRINTRTSSSSVMAQVRLAGRNINHC